MNLLSLSNAGVALFLLSFVAVGQTSADLAHSLGISFPGDSPSTVLLTRDGKTYTIDPAAKTVRELATTPPANSQMNGAVASLFAANCAGCHGEDGRGIASVGTPNFRDPAFQSAISSTEMRNAIEHGKGGTMPAWSGNSHRGRFQI